MLVWGSIPRSSARSQAHATYEVKSSWPQEARRSATTGLTSGISPVRTSSSLEFRRTASSSRRSTSSGSWMWACRVANEQYLQ